MKRLPVMFALLLLLGSIIAWFWLGGPAITSVPDETGDTSLPSTDLTNGAFADWPQFRGPDQGRCSPDQALPLIWSENSNVVWKIEVPGSGVSSPVVSDGKIWLTTALDEGRSLRAMAFSQSSGTLLTAQEVFVLSGSPPKHAVNSYSSSTPVVDKEHVVVAYGPHGIACLRTSDGAIVWKNTLLKFDDEKMGTGASPILTGDLIVIHCDGVDQRFIAALKKQTGEVVWKTPRSNPTPQSIAARKSFSTPMLRDWNGAQQLISSSSYRLFAYDPPTGRELWSVEIPGFCAVPAPLVKEDWLFVCTGFNKAQLYAFQSSTSQDKPPRLMWKLTRSAPLVPSPVLVDNHIYMVADNGVASCVEARTGRLIWNERIGGTYWASVLSSPGRVYFFAEDGSTTILAASPQFRVLAKNQLNGEIMATPAMTDNALFVRTKTHLYRLQMNRR